MTRRLLSFIIAISGIILILSCSKDELPVDPTQPTKPTIEDRKQSFHCSIHNLTYRFPEYVQDQYKELKMPCPQCNAEIASSFLMNNKFTQWQILCPIDSTWTTFEQRNLLTKDARFFPRYEYKDVMSSNLTVLKNYSIQNLFDLKFHDFFCYACVIKLLDTSIAFKQDSIAKYRDNINKIIGLTFSNYPFNNGFPPDRRVRAQAVLDSIRNILPTIDPYYNPKYSSINGLVGCFTRARQDYIYSQKNKIQLGTSLPDETRYVVSSDKYISDTIVINIGGGPDYSLLGTGVSIELYKGKNTSYSIQNKVITKAHRGTPFLSNGKNRIFKVSKINKASSAQYELSADADPKNIDLWPSQYIERKYNTYTTSIFNIFHPQKGNQFLSDGSMYTWNFINLAKTVGGYNNKFPYNIVTTYYAELLNDVGTLEIRTVVNWCKARGKKMVLMGSSWGGAMIMEYLRYYGTEDFEKIIIADQNPNIPADILTNSYLDNFIYGGNALKYGTDSSYKEVNLNMCLISTDTYRRMEWLTGKNLSNVTFYCAATDGTVGVIPANDIATLKSQGAKVYVFPAPIAHGVFSDYRAWYRYITPTLQ